MTDNQECKTCTGSSLIRSTANHGIKSNISVKSNCSNEWIDSKMLGYRFGTDYCNGLRRTRFFPTWLLEECVEDTKPGDLGFPDTCEPNVYYQIRNGLVYRVEYDCNGREISNEYIKSAKIKKCSIDTIDGNQIENPCSIFKNSSLTVPISEFRTEVNGDKQLNPNIILQPITVTDNCQLKSVYDSSLARKAVLPALGCLVKYDIPSDTATVSLGGLIDNETIRLKPRTGPCETIFSVTYAQDNIIGDGTPSNPLIARVRTDGTTITGDGTSTNPLKAINQSSNVFVDPNQFSGDGKSQATQYSIKPCVIPNTTFTAVAKNISITNPLGIGTNFRTEQASLSKRFKSNNSWTINDLPSACAGKKVLAQLTITIVSNLNILSYPVHLAGNAVLSNGIYLAGGTGAKMPGFQIPRGIAADYGDSRGTTNTITHLVLLDGNSATINFETEVDFPNNVDPNTTPPINPFNNNALTKNDYFESLSALLVVLGVY